MNDGPSLVSLTIYLAKPGKTRPVETIPDVKSLNAFPVTDDNGELGTLYVQHRSSKPPPWGAFFAPQVPISQLGTVSSTAAVLHVVVDGRAFLLTFGQGRHLIDDMLMETRFGLRVTLNSIGESNFRSIDKHTLDTYGRHTRVQAGREAAPSEFGLDIERDLLRGVTGSPVDKSLGSVLSGVDSLHALVRVDLDSLRGLLSRYLEQFGKESYREKFPWLNQIGEERDPLRLERLDSLMLSVISKRQFDKCWLVVPEPIEWAEVAGFRYGMTKKHSTYPDIEFGSFFRDRGIEADGLTIEYLRGHSVTAVDGEGRERYSWSVYDCLYCEVEDGGETFVLTGRHWYRVARDFAEDVTRSYQRIPAWDELLPEYDDKSEGAYNERVAASAKGKYAMMDRKLITVGGGYNKIEFCDLFSRNNELIHVKRYGGSGVLSHLFAQGVVSGQLFASSDTFRRDVNDVLPRGHKLSNWRIKPDTSNYRIVFAIVGGTSKNPALPFFSRLSARNAANMLEGYGYKVALAIAALNDTAAKVRKVPARKAKGASGRRR